MLEGLEISIKKFKDLYINNTTFRFDSEYFKKEYLHIFSLLNKTRRTKLDELTTWITQGPNPTFNANGIPCLTGRNISKGRVTYDEPDYVDEEEYQRLSNYQLKIGDTLITLKGKGSIGKIGYVTDDRAAIFSRDIGVIRPYGINPAYVNAFILSKYGSKLIERGETGGTGQTTLTTSYLKNMEIPRFNFEDKIGDLVEHSEDLLQRSEAIYNQANNLLLDETNFADFEVSKEPVNVKSFRDSFLSTGRLDAEYYQPKYEQFVKKIIQQRHNKLRNIVDIQKSIEPGTKNYSDKGLPFLRVSDYSQFEISDPDKKLSEIFCKENRGLISKLKPRKGTILFSKDGSVGIAHLLRTDMDLVTSGAILHLSVKDTDEVLPEYLTLVLNSELVQTQAERDAGGSIILHWRVNEIEEVVIPVIDYSKQREIAELINESFKLRDKSNTLLEIAKQAVEIAIEEGEEQAIKVIEDYS